MAKCTRCGRKGFFLKLTNGLCDNCVSTMRMEQEQAALKAQMEETQECSKCGTEGAPLQRTHQSNPARK